MNLKDSLITPEEACRLYWVTPFLVVGRATEVADCFERNERCASFRLFSGEALGCVWNAGRVQGIREERARRRRNRPGAVSAAQLARMYHALPIREKWNFIEAIKERKE